MARERDHMTGLLFHTPSGILNNGGMWDGTREGSHDWVTISYPLRDSEQQWDVGWHERGITSLGYYFVYIERREHLSIGCIRGVPQ
jgi:hypothetical protein